MQTLIEALGRTQYPSYPINSASTLKAFLFDKVGTLLHSGTCQGPVGRTEMPPVHRLAPVRKPPEPWLWLLRSPGRSTATKPWPCNAAVAELKPAAQCELHWPDSCTACAHQCLCTAIARTACSSSRGFCTACTRKGPVLKCLALRRSPKTGYPSSTFTRRCYPSQTEQQ